MRHSIKNFEAIAVVILMFSCGIAGAMTLEEALTELESHKFGQNQQALDLLRDAVVTSHSDPVLRNKLNDGLIRILDSDAAYDAKQFVCRQLALTATEEHISVLAGHLGDEKMAHMAIYVLTHIGSPEVDKALISALEKTTDNARLGTIDILGNRRCVDAVKPLGRLVISADEQTAIAAVRALGHIGTEAAYSQFVLHDVADDPPRKLTYTMKMAFAHANLDFADRFLEDGMTKQAEQRYRFAFDEHNPSQIRAAGLKGLVATMDEKASPFVAESLRSDNKQLYGMAAMIVRTVPEKRTADTMAAELAELAPNVQVLLINALAARSDGAGVSMVKTACRSGDDLVKGAALDALGKIGDDSCVPLLVEHDALDSLASLPGENVNSVLIGRLGASDNAKRVTACRALLARDAAEAAPALINVTRAANPSVRAEAIKALHSLAGSKEMPAMIDLIFRVEPAEADQVGKALVAVARRNSIQRECIQDILSKYDQASNTDQRVALLVILGELGHDCALPILRKSLQDDNSRIRYAAIKALSAWPDAKPSGDLFEVAESADSPTHRVLALRGAVNLVDASALSADQKLAHYRRAMKLAHQDAERKKVLSVLAGLDTVGAFRMAVSHLDNPSLRNEAALTACRIAQEIYASKGRQIKGDLERIIVADIGDSTKQQAREILQKITQITFYVTDWQVSGPYVQKDKNYDELFDIRFAPEIDGGKDAKWQEMPTGTDPAQPWYLDLLKALNGGEQRVAYLRAVLEWPAEQRVTLRIGSDDGIKVWVNGQLVHANNIARGFTKDKDTATTALKKGENIILMKITQNGMPWGASLRVDAPGPAPGSGSE